MHKIGIDLGGTKIEAVVLDKTGQSCWRERIATPKGDYLATLNAISSLVNKARLHFDLSPSLPVGIGTPGALFYDEFSQKWLLQNSNSTALNSQPFLEDLHTLLGCDIKIENDANCFALAETLSGQGVTLVYKPNVVFGVILGTGVGGGVVVHDRLLSGKHHITGEWGHNSLPVAVLGSLPENERNRPCYCGRKDCVETYLSGPGLVDSYQRRFNAQLTSHDIISQMRMGDFQANIIWENYLAQLGAALAQVVNILDPDLIVLGGGMSQIDEIYTEIHLKMQPHVFAPHFQTTILPAKLGDSAGVFGAAWLTAS